MTVVTVVTAVTVVSSEKNHGTSHKKITQPLEYFFFKRKIMRFLFTYLPTYLCDSSYCSDSSDISESSDNSYSSD